VFDDRSTAVLITAKDAEATIAKAVISALAQPLASEVVVVDDGSRSDGTARAAAAADDGSGRLKIVRLPENRGPAQGRNTAIEASRAPFLCILDADDFMAIGRLERLFERGGEDWDVLADDILFFDAPDAGFASDRLLPQGFPLPHDLTLSEFGRGNLPSRRRPRRELGFLKPLIRRAFLDAHRIRYDRRLRLGEDLVLYARCLLAGARFRMVEACGYCAVQSPASLSGQHRTQDIARLHRALIGLAAEAAFKGQPIGDLALYIRSTRNNLALRRALDARRDDGWRGFAAALSDAPASLPFVLGRIAGDKLRSIPAAARKARPQAPERSDGLRAGGEASAGASPSALVTPSRSLETNGAQPSPSSGRTV
jgi:succinoglycan biosynthesis protein ExoU